MSKPFKTLDEQISILKSRGLIVHDDESAKLSLLCNNYYNVINYYSKFFMIPGTDNYLHDVSFNEILSVYYFDKEIKSIFLKATIDIEKCLKSMIAYYFSESHPEDYSYLNVNNFDCSKITKTVNLTQEKPGWENKFDFPKNLTPEENAAQPTGKKGQTVTIKATDSGATINISLEKKS